MVNLIPAKTILPLSFSDRQRRPPPSLPKLHAGTIRGSSQGAGAGDHSPEQPGGTAGSDGQGTGEGVRGVNVVRFCVVRLESATCNRFFSPATLSISNTNYRTSSITMMLCKLL